MKKVNLICIFLITFTTIVTSQDNYKNYDWADAEYVKPISDEPKTVIKKHEIVEFDIDQDSYTEYNLTHTIEYIQSSDEVERNNKKYIVFKEGSELVKAKARVIKSNKNVTELSNSDILEAFDEETKQKLKYFALEGLETGSIVEVLYVLKKTPQIYGTYMFLQDKYPVEDYKFELFCPNYLEFAFDLKHDTTSVNIDTLIDGWNRYTLNIKTIEGLKYEDSSPYNSLRKRLTYKIDKNLIKGTSGIVSYETASQNIYNNLYRNIEKADQKALEKFAKGIKFGSDFSEAQKIREIEDYVKGNINILDFSDKRFNSLNFSISNKTSTSFGITRILVNLYKLFNIEHQIVSTTNRTKIPFEKEFDSYHNLSQYLVFFPTAEIFVCPDKFEYRTPIIPAEYTDNYGLFIKEVSLGEFKSAIGEIKYIPELPYKKNHHNIDLKATIADDFSNVELSISQSSLGYYANFLQAFLDLVGEDVYQDIAKNYIGSIMENIETDEWSFQNVGATNIDKKPLILELVGSNSALIDFAGDNYLFKAGELIGPQVEMYSETKRKLPVHDKYKREFIRKLEIIIPEGYEVRNPDDLKVYADYVKDGKKILLFDSKYEIDGQKIIVTINEYYDQVSYDLSEYGQYRKVVNSASDFNKVVLILAKKK